MKKCEGCKCANCVRNIEVCSNTPTPCVGCMCDLCKREEFAVYYCNKHLTIEEVEYIGKLLRNGLTIEEAFAIIKAQKER